MPLIKFCYKSLHIKPTVNKIFIIVWNLKWCLFWIGTEKKIHTVFVYFVDNLL